SAPRVPGQLRADAIPAGAIAAVHLRPAAAAQLKSIAQDDKRERVGFARDVALESESPMPAPSWIALPDGSHAARLALTSPQAASLRLALRARGLPAAAELRFV